MIWKTKYDWATMTNLHRNDRMAQILVARSADSDLVRSSRHAAAIVYKNNIIAFGNNQLKTHPIMMKWGKNPESLYLHAEVDAIVQGIKAVGREGISECDLYVLRTNRMGKIASSQPCEGCKAFITDVGIANVYYS